MNLEIIDDPAASLAELKAADQELTARLARFRGQREATTAKSDQVAMSATPEKGAAAIVAELQAIDLTISSAQKLQTRVQGRIAAIEAQVRAKAEAEERARQLGVRRDLKRQRNAAINRAELHLAQAAEAIKEALRVSTVALRTSSSPPSVHVQSSIREGLNLVPALTKRCWLQIGFQDPRIPDFDNLYAAQVGPISEILDFENDQIGLPRE